MRAVQLMGMLGRGVRHLLIAHDGRHEALRQLGPEVEREVIAFGPAGGLWRRLRAMRELLREARPDLLLTYNWGAVEWLLAARLERFRAVVHHEDGFGPDETERRLWRRNGARWLLLRQAEAVVVPSRRLERIARREWGGGRRVVYLPNGVDLRRFAPAARKPGDETVFVCVGALRPEKNQVLAVEALARASCRNRARLVLVGDGADRGAILQRAVELGVQDRVEMVGAVTDTAPYYRRSDVFVIPSRTEQMPLSLLEAMATGLPVVGADVGDVAQMVADDNRRWIVPAGDAALLARAMDEAALDPAARAVLGLANRRKVERDYEKGSCYGRYCELYLRVVRGLQTV
jgi:glycosyltransferase involved in cell wall biosynthesis